MRFHHVGYLVKDIDKSIQGFEKLGLKNGEIFFDEERLANICFMGQFNSHEIELIEPEENSDIFPLLKKFANNPYHVCYEVDDIDKTISECVSRGFLLFKDKMKAKAISKNAQVAFLMHAKVGIIELVQDKEDV